MMQKLCQLILKLIGWKIIGELPHDKKYIIIVAPHTSNWDMVIGLFARFAIKTKINFLAKKEIFFFPLGYWIKAMGGRPVDRTKKGNTVNQAVELFRHHDKFILALTPEGTRSTASRWKEGFYHIASQANLPIVMIGFDYPTKEIRIHAPFWPTGDIDEDFPQFVSYFRTIQGRYPKNLPDYLKKE